MLGFSFLKRFFFLFVYVESRRGRPLKFFDKSDKTPSLRGIWDIRRFVSIICVTASSEFVDSLTLTSCCVLSRNIY